MQFNSKHFSEYLLNTSPSIPNNLIPFVLSSTSISQKTPKISSKIAQDLLALSRSISNASLQNSCNRLAKPTTRNLADSHQSTSTFRSDVEQQILNSTYLPMQLSEVEEVVSLNGERGVLANKSEIERWRGSIPIEQYEINRDTNPEIIIKRPYQSIDYVQEVAVRYLRPPTPPAPGNIIIKEEANIPTCPAPPFIIRQQPCRMDTPEPLVIREAPPTLPTPVCRKLITILGKRLPPPPRKVILERLPKLPCKPQTVYIERWLPYQPAKRRVIYQKSNSKDLVVVKPNNVIVQWESPQTTIKKEVKHLGVVKANPSDYVQRYGSQIKQSHELPSFVSEIKAPEGLQLAADFKFNGVYELEGDIQALKLVDLDRENLSEYRSQVLQRTGSLIAVSRLSHGTHLNESSQNSSTSRISNFDDTVMRSPTFFLPTTGASPYICPLGNIGIRNLASPSTQTIENIFNAITRTVENKITREDAERALLVLNSRLGRSYGEDDVDAFFSKLDINQDGYTDFEEFKRVYLF